ncbi:SusC/RagA family TonB-linked outer membrane protein [Bacteroides thetaiotaomicron]|nr:SusC/RagA family TonB-linked outer membrane protein [Bacteroides thetaiotaomicron]
MQLADTLSIGYQMNVSSRTSSYSINGVNASAFEKSPYIDISKALYGKVAGLNVYQGTGSSADNVSTLSIHGNAPLVLIDGFPRDISDITSMEIESCYVLKDAAAAALYGMRGANGVVLITTKRGISNGLKVNVDYNFGVNTQFRSPDFADAYTYANALNTALSGDGLPARYNAQELDAFRTGIYPYDYPNVDWWNETLNNTGLTHNLKMSFSGGSDKFRFYTVVDYYRDRSMLKKNTEDTRFDTTPTDTRLTVRTNLDVKVTESTLLKAGIVGRLKEFRGAAMDAALFSTKSMAFHPLHSPFVMRMAFMEVVLCTTGNPVALLKDYGHIRNVYGTLLADLSIRQDLSALTKGLAAEASVSFDNIGGMNETTNKEYRYMNSNASITSDGTLVTTPAIYGTDSETLGHTQPFERLMLRSDFQAKVDYNRTFGKHQVGGALIYDMQSVVKNGRNNSQKNQSVLVNATYTYDNRYSLNAVFNRSGSAYLPDGDKYSNYPAVSAAWIVSNEAFMEKVTPINLFKIRASYGLSGWDGNLSHELWRQSYGSGGAGYNFGVNAGGQSGGSEGDLPVIGLVAEKSQKATFGFDLAAFDNRLNATVEGFYEKRSDILVSGANSTSGIIGITVGQVNEGIYKYKGVDASLSWNDKIGDFHYGIGASMSYLNTEVVNVNQAYQEYDYLYTKGNRIGQMYGLEAIGFFNSQQEINNSPQQTFSDVAPGDVKYKDQNGDNRIDEKDIVKMFGSSVPRFYFGFNLNFSYKRLELSADFQGMTGVTVSLLNSPLYSPLVSNGNISNTFLNEEISWTPENKTNATMPRLTTQENLNNYRARLTVHTVTVHS